MTMSPDALAQRRIGAVAAPPPAVLAALVVLLGALLRLYHVTRLSLWVDEGITVMFSHLPWPAVLGLRGVYDAHPPLYYALVKLVAAVGAPDVVAGRLVSVVAGTAGIAVLYLLVARLATTWVGLTAATVLALSPSHLWYSQEARQYALDVTLALVSYLALVAFLHSCSRVAAPGPSSTACRSSWLCTSSTAPCSRWRRRPCSSCWPRDGSGGAR